MNILMLMMGGVGSRFGMDTPKQYTLIDGKPIFLGILEHYEKLGCISLAVVVAQPEWHEKIREWCSGIGIPLLLANGGSTRSESVRNGFDAMKDRAHDEDVVLVHDATHPYLDSRKTLEAIELIRKHGAATLASFGYDTVYMLNENGNIGSVIPRTKVVNGASPEGFLFEKISNVYRNATQEELEKMTSVGAIARANNIEMCFVQTDVPNLKITFQRDMALYLLIKDSLLYV